MTEHLVEVIVRIRARPATVFGFFTDADLYRRWMGDTAELEAKPGGLYRVSVGSGQVAEGRFLVVEPPTRVSFSWGWVGDTTVPPESSTVEITLTADGDGTLLRLVHTGLPGSATELHLGGWRLYLARLGDVLGQQAVDPGDGGIPGDPRAAAGPAIDGGTR